MDSRKLIGGLLAASAIGVAIGMLLAPRSGSKTREYLASKSRQLTDGLKETVDESVQNLKEGLGLGAEKLVKNGRDMINSGIDKAK